MQQYDVTEAIWTYLKENHACKACSTPEMRLTGCTECYNLGFLIDSHELGLLYDAARKIEVLQVALNTQWRNLDNINALRGDSNAITEYLKGLGYE